MNYILEAVAALLITMGLALEAVGIICFKKVDVKSILFYVLMIKVFFIK